MMLALANEEQEGDSASQVKEGDSDTQREASEPLMNDPDLDLRCKLDIDH